MNIPANKRVTAFALPRLVEIEKGREGAAFSFPQAGRIWSEQDRSKLLRPTAIVPNVGTICPRDRLARDETAGALQHVIWNIRAKNYFVAFVAIRNVPLHGTIPCVYGANLIVP